MCKQFKRGLSLFLIAVFFSISFKPMLSVALAVNNDELLEQEKLVRSAPTVAGKVYTPNLGSDPIEEILKNMSVREKARLVVGDKIERLEILGAAGSTTGSLKHYGIPEIILADGPAGLRITPKRPFDKNEYICTAFPVASHLASSWDVDLVEKVGRAMGNEVYKYGADILLAPALNIHRDPLCGRNFEYYSEDPLISGKMAQAISKGVKSQGVGTTIKHFAANNQESNRKNVDVVISERALREIYLRGFEVVVKESQPWAVMSSYNKINGTYAAQNEDLLTTVLRDDWGYKGLVMTDWISGDDPVEQQIAGNDLLMPGNPISTLKLIKAVEKGQLDEEILNRSCKRILEGIMKTPRFNGYEAENDPDLKSHAEVACQASAEGMILLKNDDNTLPFTEVKTVAPFGRTSYNPIKGGGGSGNVYTRYNISLVEGLENAGKSVYDTSKLYLGPAEMLVSQKKASEIAQDSDIAVITIGRRTTEALDRRAVKGDYYLSDVERKLIDNVSNAYHEIGKKVAVVLNIAGPIEVASWQDKVDAILLAWLPGQEGGNAISDILLGKVNPSGKLVTTFPLDYDDVPSSLNFPGNRPILPTEVVYEEDIYVGYRYYDTFDIDTAYEFGYGISYTDFEYSNLELDSDKFKDTMSVTLDIKNIGDIPGKEVVQLYISAPDDKLDKPVQELRGFAKTRLLAPGEVETISFEINPRDLTSFDEEKTAWVAEAGTYEVRLGASSRDIRLVDHLNLDRDLIVERVNKALIPQKKINRLKPPKRDVMPETSVTLKGPGAVSPDEIFTVSLDITNVPDAGISSENIIIRFEPQAFDFISALPKLYRNQDPSRDMKNDDKNIEMKKSVYDDGIIVFIHKSNRPITEDGEFLELKFKAKKCPSRSGKICLSKAILVDGEGKKIRLENTCVTIAIISED